MKILVVTNRYPPDGRGGYALGCRRTVEALESRGHELRVLTSSRRPGKDARDGRILPRLARDAEAGPSWKAAFLKELVNQSSFRLVFRDFRPDVVLAFNLSGISMSVATLARELGLPLVFYVANDWLALWERDIWHRAWPESEPGFKVLRILSHRYGLRPVSRPLRSALAVYVSRHLEAMTRQTGKVAARAAVVPWAIDTRRFSPRASAGGHPLRLLYAGRIESEKRIDLVIQSLGLLKQEIGGRGLSLTIAGDERVAPAHSAYLHSLASACGVPGDVTFTGFVAPDDMPDLYRAHDLFVFPSAAVEPQTVSVLEAMACGLGVVSTATGGNAEFLSDEVNALVIPKENGERCAAQILRLVRDPGLLKTLGSGARNTVEKGYTLETVIPALEDILREASQVAGLVPPAAISEEPGASPVISPASLDRLVTRAGRWARLGGLVVHARNLARPRKVVKFLRRIGRSNSGTVSLLIFPTLLEPFFRLAGLRRASSRVAGRPPRSVLVVQMADLGDVILSGPFLRELRRFLGRAKITLVVQSAMVNVIERCPYVDEIVPYNWRTVRDWETAFRGAPGWWWSSLRAAATRLWKRRFDLAVSLRWNNDPCQAAALILMYASGAARRVAYLDAQDDFKRDSLRFVDRLISDGPVRGSPKHEVEYQLDLLRFLGGRPESSGLEVWTDAGDESVARAILARPGLSDGGPLVALAPGARWSFRRWPPERFTELGAWLQDEFRARIMIFAGKSERPLANRIESGLRKDRTVNLAGRTTLRQMAAVLKHCDLFIGIDSGPMHVATAAGVPTVGLFGAGEYGRFRPWGTAHEVIRLGLTCYPCSESCLFDRALCIEGITADQVKEALSKKLTRVLK
jgi:ADP-heptose:LPS heptosyltransferase/glycosyltransferase involved in cell wall biosynthesis